MTSLGAAALLVLTTSGAAAKAEKSIKAAREWHNGKLTPECSVSPPERPARPEKPELLPPGQMPRRRGGKETKNRIALLHAIAHIELNAIDLAWDIIARFGHGMPRKFLDDWVTVGADEARHFTLLEGRLRSLGASYGDLPAHDGLWQAAQKTSGDILARLAVVPLVLEARGLDVTPGMIKKLEGFGDFETAAILKRIYQDEIGHVRAGTRWFITLCEARGLKPEATFQTLVKSHFSGTLKPPFNTLARSKAGLPETFYSPLAEK